MVDAGERHQEGWQCINCGASRGGRWCAECGQDGERRLRTAPQLAVAAIGAVTDLDGRTWTTLRRLVREPGALVRDYASGKFVSQVSPMRLYLVMSAVYFFLGPVMNGGMVRFLGGEGAGGWFSFGPLTWDSEILFLVLIPSWAIAARLLLAGGGRQFEEVFVFSLHYQVYFLLVVTAMGVLAALAVRTGVPFLAPPLLLLSLVLSLVYLVRALHKAFELSGIRLALLAPVLFLLHLGGGQALHNLL